MTAQLAPTPIFKGWDNNGFPLALGFLTTYAAGTLTKIPSYVDSTQTTQNPNPRQLNFRGEMPLWLDPTLAYKIALTDVFGNIIPGYPVDNVQGAIGVASNIVPSITNTFTLGTPSITFANAYLGPNGAPVLDSASGNIGYYARTAAESAAGVTPTDFVYPEGWLQRYGAIADGVTDNSTALQKCLNVCQATISASVKYGQSVQGLPGVYRYTIPLTITSSLTIAPPSIGGPRIFAPVGGSATAYGGIEFLFDPPSNPANILAQASFAIAIVTGTVGAEAFARVRIKGLGLSWTQPKAGGIYVIGAVDVGIEDCWLTGGLTNYSGGTAAGICIYCLDAIVSHFQRNTFRMAGYGIVAENFWNENEVSRNDFDRMSQAGVVIRGKAGSSARSSIRSNNFFGDGAPGIQYGVYVSGVANGVTIDENTFEVVTRGPIVASNIDLIDASNNGTPADIHISGNVLIATNGAASSAAIQLLCNGATVWGNSLLSPTGNVQALVNVSSSATNVSIYGNDTAGKPLIVGALAPSCVVIDDVLYRTMPWDSSEATKTGIWSGANAGTVWWNNTLAALRMWMGGSIASIQPCGVLTIATNSATPGIAGINVLQLQYTSPTNITNLTGAFPGQEVTVIYSSGSVPTMVSGSFVLQGGGNFAMAVNNTLTLVYNGSGWYEKGRKT